MGYRLEISELIPTKNSGGKLYGYIPEIDLKKLKSYNWLLERKYIEEDCEFNYGYSPEIVLDKTSFREFMQLYAEDWFDTYQSEFWLEDFEEVINSDNFKLIDWF